MTSVAYTRSPVADGVGRWRKIEMLALKATSADVACIDTLEWSPTRYAGRIALLSAMAAGPSGNLKAHGERSIPVRRENSLRCYGVVSVVVFVVLEQ